MQQRVKVLVVDDDPQVFDLMQQILNLSDYELLEAADGAEGIKMVGSHNPQLIILDLVMPNLTGQDMLVGIKQQNYQGPIIVTTKAGMEDKAIKAFRLGATDFVTKPIRPPEIIAAIDRALEDLKLQQEKAHLVQRLQTANHEMQEKVKELTLLSNIGQILTGMRNIDELFEVVLSSMLDMTGADYASLLLYDPVNNKITLAAGKNLSLVMQEQLGEVIKDEVADLVLRSQQPLVAAGEGLQQFRLPRDTKAVVYVPMVAHGKAMGVLTIGNYKKRTEFSNKHAHLLKAMSDYVAIGITNAHLFSALDARARNTESALKAKDAERHLLFEDLKNQVYQPLIEIDKHLTQVQQQLLAPPVKQQLEHIQEQHRRVLFALQELAQSSRPTKGIYRITPQS